MDDGPWLRALGRVASLRWETTDGHELGLALLGAFAAAIDGTAIAIGPEGICVDASGKALGSAPRAIDPPSGIAVAMRPRAGWSRTSAEHDIAIAVGAQALIVLPIAGRHVHGSLVIWTRTRRGLPPRNADLGDALLASLARGFDLRRVLRRLAEVSRRAHADAQRLRRDHRGRTPEGESNSAAMRSALARADAVAAYDTPVLVMGPTGAGKELLARRIHARSRATAGPFVQLNCGALPEALAESEIFGHERGAFTGAVRLHRGVFERADEGTLLLDEVGDLPLSLQVKLLRVLQERTFVRVGGEQPLETKARVIAATHRPLRELVERGVFREDLFYRLAVFPIEIPGLAQRREDIPALVATLLRELCTKLGRPVPVVSPRALEQLTRRAWPGNVRELANVLESALITSPADALEIPDAGEQEVSTLHDLGPGPTSFDEGAARVIVAALERSRGKIYGDDGAAARLGLKPATLQSKMKRLGIDRRRFV